MGKEERELRVSMQTECQEWWRLHLGACVKARVVCLDSPWAAGCVTRMESPEGGVEGWTPPRARSGGGRTLRAKGTNPGRLSMLSLRGLGPRRLCSAPRCLRNPGPRGHCQRVLRWGAPSAVPRRLKGGPPLPAAQRGCQRRIDLEQIFVPLCS